MIESIWVGGSVGGWSCVSSVNTKYCPSFSTSRRNSASDVVVCSDVLYTAQTAAKVFALAKACLRPGGAAYIGSDRGIGGKEGGG